MSIQFISRQVDKTKVEDSNVAGRTGNHKWQHPAEGVLKLNGTSYFAEAETFNIGMVI